MSVSSQIRTMIGPALDISSPLPITVFTNNVLYTSSGYNCWSGLGYMPVIEMVRVRGRAETDRSCTGGVVVYPRLRVWQTVMSSA